MAFTITYDGNGSNGGSVPVDTKSYNAGDKVTVLLPGSMTRTGATFAYWNTKADGTGTFYGWPKDMSFLAGGNLTLYAQWFVTTGLNNGGATTHYAFSYDESLRASGLEPGRTQTLMANAEADYTIMANWFRGVTLRSSPINIYVTSLTGGAHNNGDIRLMPNTKSPNELRCYLVSEITESFMQSQNKGWGFLPGVLNEESCGEALSLFLTQQFALMRFFPNPYSGFTANTANGWLNTSLPAADPASTRFVKNSDGTTTDFGSRFDYVNSVLPYPGNGPGTGGSMLFIYYLFHQLGFTIQQIIAAAPGYPTLNTKAPLRGVYKNLTGDDSDPFPRFKQLLDAAYPESQISSILGANPDDPWPLPRPGVLTGVVTSADTGEPIDAAVVVIDGPASAGVHAEHLQLDTGPDGSYTTPPLAPGSYTIEGSASDYVPVTINVTVNEGVATTRAGVALPVRYPFTVRGTVTDQAHAPLPGVSVTLVGEPGPIWQRTTTESTGAYSLTLDPGQYTGAYGLYAQLAGYADGYVELASIPNGATLIEPFVLLALGTLTGLITDASVTPATPIVGAQVTAGPVSAASDATGRYTLPLAPGSVSVRVAALGYEFVAASVTVAPAGTAEQDFTLEKASATLTGTVLDANTGLGVRHAFVRVDGANGVQASPDGAYTLSRVPAGPARVVATAQGYRAETIPVEIVAHDTVSMNIYLAASGPNPHPPTIAE